ncbi:PREDICTED: uncharacterized protein LOC107182135 [Myotis davidii]|uniref:uncharacterized protein LOC107182135 n=1 Tax=Myotis davidii TaxID=225400 RepID=UPI000766ECF1|nr:PREDICTED: uncharacterized protein LOC107182135 [Myotis davidii]
MPPEMNAVHLPKRTVNTIVDFTRVVIPRLSGNVPHFLAHLPLKVNSPFNKKKILVESYPTRKGRVAVSVVTFNKTMAMEEIKLTQNVHNEALRADVSDKKKGGKFQPFKKLFGKRKKKDTSISREAEAGRKSHSPQSVSNDLNAPKACSSGQKAVSETENTATGTFNSRALRYLLNLKAWRTVQVPKFLNEATQQQRQDPV